MKARIASLISGTIIRHPVLVALTLVLCTAISGWRASHLSINNNQLELIPQDLPAVVATKDMIKMIESVGFIMLPLKGRDLDHVKVVAEEIGTRIEALPEIRYVRYKQDVKYVRDRIGLYVETPDLKEASRRVRKKIRSILNKNNPFAIQLTEVKDEPLELDDLVDKYRRVGKKEVNDPYYIDINREMVLMVIKPRGISTDLEFTKKLLAKMAAIIDDYNANNTVGAELVEHYGDFAPTGTVTYGYTGSFKTNLDDSETIQKALIPTSAFAFLGILVYLLITLRRVTQVAVIMATLTFALINVFGVAEMFIGELNTVTSMLAAILMGLGIDYGIHFTYRFREEYTKGRDLPGAIEQTILHSGSASLGSALTTAVALLILLLSDFRGYSEFGVIAGLGVPFSFAVMYIAIPTFYLLVDRYFASFKETLILPGRTAADIKAIAAKKFPFAKPILLGTVILTAVLAFFAMKVEFDYDARSLMTADRPSIVLQQELKRRYEMSADPVAMYTPNLEETKALYDALHPPGDDSMIDMVMSVYTLVPPMKQQKANRKILDKLKRAVDPLNAELIEDETIRKYFDEGKLLLNAQPFTFEDVPDHIMGQFRPYNIKDYPGFLTFIYAKTALWDGRELLEFAQEVGTVEVGDKAYHSAGMAVLFAQLAEIVLHDGIMFTLIAAIAIFLITLVDFRSLRGAIFAMLPLVAGITWMLGFMAIFDWRLNYANIVVMPLVFGYGISAGVHLYHRFHESQSVMVALRFTGGAVAASSVTTLVGWGALLISHHRALSSMGILACFGVASTLLVSLTVLPALLQVTQPSAPPDTGSGPGAEDSQPPAKVVAS